MPIFVLTMGSTLILRSPVLFCITKIEFNPESQTIAVNDMFPLKFQVATEEDNTGVSPCESAQAWGFPQSAA
jgi:hypothetical protein